MQEKSRNKLGEIFSRGQCARCQERDEQTNAQIAAEPGLDASKRIHSQGQYPSTLESNSQGWTSMKNRYQEEEEDFSTSWTKSDSIGASGKECTTQLTIEKK